MAYNPGATTLPDTEFFSGSATASCKNMCASKADNQRRRRCERRCLAGLPDDEGTAPVPGGTAAVAEDGTTTGAQYDPNASREVPKSYAELGGNIENYGVEAPAGTYAASLGSLTGLPIQAQNPYAFTAGYLGQQYGTAANSPVNQLALQYLNPQDKALGILGERPELFADMVNFGAQLYEQIGGGMGTQLSPHSMITTVVNSMLSSLPEARSGDLDPDSVSANPLLAIATQPDPTKALNSFISMMTGVLEGTMPQDALAAYLASLEAYAWQVINQEFMNKPLLGEDSVATNGSWIEALVDQLGPTLGL